MHVPISAEQFGESSAIHEEPQTQCATELPETVTWPAAGMAAYPPARGMEVDEDLQQTETTLPDRQPGAYGTPSKGGSQEKGGVDGVGAQASMFSQADLSGLPSDPSEKPADTSILALSSKLNAYYKASNPEVAARVAEQEEIDQFEKEIEEVVKSRMT